MQNSADTPIPAVQADGLEQRNVSWEKKLAIKQDFSIKAVMPLLDVFSRGDVKYQQ